MSSDDFESAVRRELAELQKRLVAEHWCQVASLEGRIAGGGSAIGGSPASAVVAGDGKEEAWAEDDQSLQDRLGSGFEDARSPVESLAMENDITTQLVGSCADGFTLSLNGGAQSHGNPATNAVTSPVSAARFEPETDLTDLCSSVEDAEPQEPPMPIPGGVTQIKFAEPPAEDAPPLIPQARKQAQMSILPDPDEYPPISSPSMTSSRHSIMASKGDAGSMRPIKSGKGARGSILEDSSDNGRKGPARRESSLHPSSSSRKMSVLGGKTSEIGSVCMKTNSDLEEEDSDEEDTFAVLKIWTQRNLTVRATMNFTATKSKTAIFDRQETAASIAGAVAAHSEDEARLLLMSRFMIFPSAIGRLCWEIVGMLLIFYDCIIIPLEVFDMPDTDGKLVMAWITRLFWTINVGVSFFTGYLKDDGTVEMRPGRVAGRYCVTWLPIDLIVVGVDWAEVILRDVEGIGVQRFANALRGIRMMRIARVLRSLKAPEIMEFINEYIRSEQVRLVAAIAKIIFLMVAVAHVIACLWFGLGRIGAGLEDSAWITRFGVEELDKSQQYVVSFHWSLSQFAGELLFEPQSQAERIFAVFVLLFAIIASASFVGSLTTSMTRLQIVTKLEASKLASLRRYLLDQSISRPLGIRVQQNAQHAMEESKKNVHEKDVELLKLISNPLLIELHFEIHAHTLMEHPFFLCYHDVNPAGIRKVCHLAISVLSLSQGDILFSNLEVAALPRMFFPISGSVAYRRNMSAPETAEKSQWLCESALWTQWTYCGTAKSDQRTRILVIDADKFQNIVSTFPTDHASTYATAFVTELNQEDHDDLTDLDQMMHRMDDMLDEVFPPPSESGSDESDDDQMEPGISSMSSPNGSGIMSTNLGGGDKRRSRDNSIFGILQGGIPTKRLSIRGSRVSDGSAGRRTSKRKSGTLRQSAKRKSNKRNSGDSETGLFGNFLGSKLGGLARNAARSVRAS